MLLSSVSVDTDALPGLVPPLTSSGGGPAGFAAQLQSLTAMMPVAEAIPPAAVTAQAPVAPAASTAADRVPAGVPYSLPGFAGNSGLSGMSLVTALMSGRGTSAANFSIASSQTAPLISQTTSRAVPILTPAPVVASDVVVEAPAPPAVPVDAQAGKKAPVTPQSVAPADVPAEPVQPSSIKKDEPVAGGKQQLRAKDREERVAEKDARPAPQQQSQQAPQLQTQAQAPVVLVQQAPVVTAPIVLAKAIVPASPHRTPVSATLTPSQNTPADVQPVTADDQKLQAPVQQTAPQITPAATDTGELAFAVKVQAPRSHAAPARDSSVRTLSPKETATASRPSESEPAHVPANTQRHDTNRDSQQQPQSEPEAKTTTKTSTPATQIDTMPAHAEPAIHNTTAAVTTSTDTKARTVAVGDDIAPVMKPEVPAAPMKDISVRIESAQGENIDVRIVRRAGDLQIAVNSANGDTTQGLRHGLSDLSDRLNAGGYRAETWHPGQTATAAETSADSGNSQHSQQQSPQGDSQSHSGSPQQDRGQRDNNQHNRPRWIEELESKVSSPAETTGQQFHGLIR